MMLEELETGWRANKTSMFDWMTTWESPKRDFKISTASSWFPEVSSRLFNAYFAFPMRRVLR